MSDSTKTPDFLPSGPEWENDDPCRFVNAMADDVMSLVRRYKGSLSQSEVIGVLERCKFTCLCVFEGVVRAPEEDDEESEA